MEYSHLPSSSINTEASCSVTDEVIQSTAVIMDTLSPGEDLVTVIVRVCNSGAWEQKNCFLLII